jgi:putative membrane protein
MMDGGGIGWAGWIIGITLMAGFWGLLFWAVVSLVRRPKETVPTLRTADEILAERFSRGEIDADEFEARRRVLEAR